MSAYGTHSVEPEREMLLICCGHLDRIWSTFNIWLISPEWSTIFISISVKFTHVLTMLSILFSLNTRKTWSFKVWIEGTENSKRWIIFPEFSFSLLIAKHLTETCLFCNQEMYCQESIFFIPENSKPGSAFNRSCRKSFRWKLLQMEQSSLARSSICSHSLRKRRRTYLGKLNIFHQKLSRKNVRIQEAEQTAGTLVVRFTSQLKTCFKPVTNMAARCKNKQTFHPQVDYFHWN